MGEITSETGRDNETQVPPTWSVRAGKYDPTLHLPSFAVIDYLNKPENHLQPDAQLRMVSGGLLISILELLNPDVASNPEVAKAMRQTVGRAVMYSADISDEQYEQIQTIHHDLVAERLDGLSDEQALEAINEPAATRAVHDLPQKGARRDACQLAERAITVLQIWELQPDIKLPVPYNK
jgi:hypothetical protein